MERHGWGFGIMLSGNWNRKHRDWVVLLHLGLGPWDVTATIVPWSMVSPWPRWGETE